VFVGADEQLRDADFANQFVPVCDVGGVLSKVPMKD
jgi:hypothetical protein